MFDLEKSCEEEGNAVEFLMIMDSRIVRNFGSGVSNMRLWIGVVKLHVLGCLLLFVGEDVLPVEEIPQLFRTSSHRSSVERPYTLRSVSAKLPSLTISFLR